MHIRCCIAELEIPITITSDHKATASAQLIATGGREGEEHTATQYSLMLHFSSKLI
jgi:hypothetical protein